MLTSCMTHEMTDLNTSDHLPITVSMAYYPDLVSDNHNKTSCLYRIDWVEAEKCGVSEVYSKLEPLFNGVYNDAEMIGAEIEHLAGILQDCAAQLLPRIQPSKRKKWRDDILSGLCAKSRLARAAWKDAGCPPDGPLYEEKCRSRRAMRTRIRWCAAKSERMRAQ